MSELSTKYLKSICKVGQGKDCCRYVTSGKDGIQCAKLTPPLNRMIDEKVSKGEFTSLGDNCAGITHKEKKQ